jgi:hypothetical protein
MSNLFIFVHGINNGPERRKTLTSEMIKYLQKNKILNLFKNDNKEDSVNNPYWVKTANWNSLGNFMKDLNDLKLNPSHWHQAVKDIVLEIEGHMDHMYEKNQLNDKSNIVFVGHSMGQPLLISALEFIQNNFSPNYKKYIERSKVITIGGPMGNPWARVYFGQMNQRIWADALKVSKWIDMWNPEDLVCGSYMYNKFLAAQSVRIDVPGHPTLFTPLKEHSSYFFSNEFYKQIKESIN